MKNFVGIEIGGTKLQMVRGDETGKILFRRRLVVESAEGAQGICEQIEQTLPDLIQGYPIEGVGVGFGGPVDWRTGKICRSHQIEGWSGFDLAGWLRKLSGLPVVIDNDANVGALGEARCGAGVNFDPVFYVTLGSGVGGGLVSAGRIYHGATPGESEIGHIRLDRTGAIVESRCSGWAVDARIRELTKREPASLLAQLTAQRAGAEARFLATAIQQGDPHAKLLLDDVADDLAFALSHVAHLFHPEMIVLGGGLSSVGAELISAVQIALPRFLMEAFAPGPAIHLAALAEDAVPVGALHLARDASQHPG